MVIQVACYPSKLERAFNHPQRRVAVAIQDAIRKRAVVRSDTHGDPAFHAKIDQRGKPLANTRQLGCVLLIRVFADDELFRIRVIAWVDTHLVHPFCGFHRCLRLKMDIRDDRHIAVALPQTLHNVLEIACVLYRRRGDAHNLTASLRQFNCLLNRRLGVHRVAGDHRLDTDGIVSADADVPHLHLARGAAAIMKRINAIVHEISNVRSLDHSRNERSYGVWLFFAGDCASSWSSFFLTKGKSCTSKNVI